MTAGDTLGSRHSEARRPDSAARDWAATRTFSKTVISGKMLVIWKVLASPRRLMSSGGSPVMSWPWKLTVPALGACSPAMTLNSVDLPAPLGPMTEKTSPCRTARLTSARAASAPKLLPSPDTSRIGITRTGSGGRPPRSPQRRAEAEQPARHEEDDEDEDDADDHEV